MKKEVGEKTYIICNRTSNIPFVIICFNCWLELDSPKDAKQLLIEIDKRPQLRAELQRKYL